jgi:hypothetical protein
VNIKYRNLGNVVEGHMQRENYFEEGGWEKANDVKSCQCFAVRAVKAAALNTKYLQIHSNNYI